MDKQENMRIFFYDLENFIDIFVTRLPSGSLSHLEAIKELGYDIDILEAYKIYLNEKNNISCLTK